MRNFETETAQHLTRLDHEIQRLQVGEQLTGRAPAVAIPLTWSAHKALPGLKAFWPLNATDDTSDILAISQAGNARHLELVGPPVINVTALGLAYMAFDGSSDWLKRPDEAHLDIIGNEAYIADQGLTVGAWVRFDNTAAAAEIIVSKCYSGTTGAWRLERDASGYPKFTVYASSTAYGQAAATTLAAASWAQVIGRWDAGTSVDIFVNGIKASNTTSIPSTIDNAAAGLFAAARDDTTTPGQERLDGDLALIFLCNCALSDGLIAQLYQTSRHCLGA